MTITENCIIPDMNENDYHNDPCETVSLSSGMAKGFLHKTELQVKLGSRRLSPDIKHKTTDAMNLGNLCHAKILGQDDPFIIAPFKDWRTNDSKDAKQAILDQDKIPLNETESGRILPSLASMHERLLDQLSEYPEYANIFDDGNAEVSAFGHDGQIWNRARFDWIKDNSLLVDYKTTGLSIAQWERNQLWADGGYIQEVHYRKVYELATGHKAKGFVYIVQENFAPYLMRVVVIDDSIRDEIERRYEYARQRFINCLETDEWRGHPPLVGHSFPAPWVVKDWEVTDAEEQMRQEDEPKENLTMAG